MEHRWGYRLRVSIPVEIYTTHGISIGAAKIENLSVSGALLVADRRPRMLTQLQVVFELREYSPGNASFNATGFVARQHDRGFGLEWCDTKSVEAAAAVLLAIVSHASEFVTHSKGLEEITAD